MEVTGPKGFRRVASGPETIGGLAEGSYTVAATGVESARGKFRVASTTQTAVISASAPTAAVNVAYEVTTGSLSLQLAGLPNGVAGDVALVTPAGTTLQVTGTSTFAKLDPGRYTLTARSVRVGAHRFTPSDSVQVIDLTPRLDPQVLAVAYAQSTGTLRIVMEDVPSGATAAVDVTGPAGFTRRFTATDSVVGVETGVYSAGATTVTVAGEQYAPTPATLLVPVTATTAGQSALFRWSRSSVRLSIALRGLPAGLAGSISISGPSGFSQTVTDSRTLIGLSPGAYVVNAAALVTPSASFSASPLAQTVDLSQPGAEASVQVAYAQVTGAIDVSIAGLPAGTPAAVTISNTAGVSRQVTASGLVTNLPAGSYLVTAASVSSGASVFSATPPTQQVTVTAGGSTRAAVTYALSTAALRVNIGGLPAGVNADVRVLGPGGPYVVTASTVLGSLQPAVYTVVAASVVAGGVTYVAAPDTQRVTVTASTTPASVDVTYGVGVGNLIVRVVGLPPATGAAITVTGPLGTVQSITGSTTLSGVVPGSYQIAAAAVTSGATTYTPTPPNQNVVVPVGGTASAIVVYSASGGSGLNLTIDNAYLVQATQTLQANVPIVAGRDALLRVFVRASASNTAQPTVRARFYSGSQLLQALTLQPSTAAVPTVISEGAIASSWNATVNGTLLQPGVSMLLDVDPAGLVAETNETDNQFPLSGAAALLDIRAVNPFQVRLVPVRQSANGLTGNVSPTNASSFVNLTGRLWPLGVVDVDVRAAYTTNAPVLTSNDANGAWSQILSELNVLRTADASSRYYVGVVRTTYNAGIAGLGYVPGRAALTWDFLPSADEVTAHELGHNFSRFHAPCGGPGGPDPNYPYAGGIIGVYGYDMIAGVLKVPSQPDVMGYCNGPWISDYNYKAVLNYRAATPGARIAGAPAARQRTLLVWGRLNGAGIILEPAFTLAAFASPPQGHGDARVQLLDATGSVLYDSPFEPERVADARDPAERHFAFAIPLDPALEARLAEVRVTAGGHRVVRRGVGGDLSVLPSRERPRLERVGGRGGEVAVRWSSSAVRGVLVRDVQSGSILSILRETPGRMVPASGEVELIVSNGVRSTSVRARVPR